MAPQRHWLAWVLNFREFAHDRVTKDHVAVAKRVEVMLAQAQVHGKKKRVSRLLLALLGHDFVNCEQEVKALRLTLFAHITSLPGKESGITFRANKKPLRECRGLIPSFF